MYVARRDIDKTFGRYSAGSVIEPAEIKNLPYLLHNKFVVEVDEHNYEEYKVFFKKRFNVTLPPLPVVLPDISDEEIISRLAALKLDLPDNLTREDVLKALYEAESKV